MKQIRWVIVFFQLSAWFTGYAQLTKQETSKTINEMANTVATVIMDKQGRSLCDYNLTLSEWYPYEVPWHTGQAINALVGAYEVVGNKKWLNVARRGGDYWTALQIKEHPVLNGMIRATHGDFIGDDLIVFATISDGTPGIYALSHATGDQRYARIASEAAQWMLDHMYDAEKGICYDNVDAETGEVQKEYSPFWKNKASGEQTLYDVSRPNTEGSLFKDAYEFTGNEAFRDAFLRLCDKLVELQDEHGVWPQFMPNSAINHSFHPRFNLWYAESLLEAHTLTKDKKYLEAAAKTARTHAKAQLKDGTILYDNYTDGRAPDKGSITGSAVAFAGIVWMRLAELGYQEFVPNIELSARWLVNNRFAQDHADKNLRGQVLETRTRFRNDRVWFVNRDIGTSFGLRFMTDYYHYRQFH